MGNPISTYNGVARITNQFVSNILIYSLIQSSRMPGAQAYYTITFTTENPLPPSASMLVTTPLAVSIVPDSRACYVISSTQTNNVCTFVQNTGLKITNAFRNQGTSYQG